MWGSFKIEACCSTFFNFLKSNSFQALRLMLILGLFLRKIQVDIRLWSEDWSRSGLDLQCSNLSARYFDINTKLIVLNESLASYVMMPLGSMSNRFLLSMISNI